MARVTLKGGFRVMESGTQCRDIEVSHPEPKGGRKAIFHLSSYRRAGGFALRQPGNLMWSSRALSQELGRKVCGL